MFFNKNTPAPKNVFAHLTSPNKNAPSTAHFNPGKFSSGLTEDRYPEGFPKGVALNMKKTKVVEWLRKKHNTDEAAMDLADRLEGCKKNDRCLSPACVKCSQAAKTFATKVVRKFLAAHPDRNKIVCVSVVPADGEVAKGKLSSQQHARNVRRWKEALGRAGVGWFVGAADWSFNEHTDDRYEHGWQQHLYGFTGTDDLKQLKKKLKKQFPASDAIPRPVQVKPWDGDKKAIRYMLKTDFRRRIGTDEGQRCEKDSTEKRECRATDKQPLRSSQKLELLLHLDQIGLSSRFLMRWLQFVLLGGSGWTIVNRAPKGRMRGNGKKRRFGA
jgi:hypothetical protein